MLGRNLANGSLEGAFAAQPFVGDDTQGILVAGLAWLALQLFGCDVGNSAHDLACSL